MSNTFYSACIEFCSFFIKYEHDFNNITGHTIGSFKREHPVTLQTITQNTGITDIKLSNFLDAALNIIDSSLSEEDFSTPEKIYAQYNNLSLILRFLHLISAQSTSIGSKQLTSEQLQMVNSIKATFGDTFKEKNFNNPLNPASNLRRHQLIEHELRHLHLNQQIP